MTNSGPAFSCDLHILSVVHVSINIVILLYHFIEFCQWFYVDYGKADHFFKLALYVFVPVLNCEQISCSAYCFDWIPARAYISTNLSLSLSVKLECH